MVNGRVLRYYHPAELPKGIRHQKLTLAGGDCVPTAEYLSKFDEMVRCITVLLGMAALSAPPQVPSSCPQQMDGFLDGEKHQVGRQTRIIVIHCTHGVNRSGYLCCRTLCRRLGLTAREALERFQEARELTMEKPNLIAALHREFPGDEPFVPAAPGQDSDSGTDEADLGGGASEEDGEMREASG